MFTGRNLADGTYRIRSIVLYIVRTAKSQVYACMRIKGVSTHAVGVWAVVHIGVKVKEEKDKGERRKRHQRPVFPKQPLLDFLDFLEPLTALSGR